MFHDKQSNIKIGTIGEDLACEYLKNNGYKIIKRNFRRPYGEIDIITTKGSGLVFFEIKTLKMRQNNTANNDNDAADGGLVPEDNLTSAKLIKLKKICEMFAVKHPELFSEDDGWQIDLLAIYYPEDSKIILPENIPAGYELLTIKGKRCLIKHYENIG